MPRKAKKSQKGSKATPGRKVRFSSNEARKHHPRRPTKARGTAGHADRSSMVVFGTRTRSNAPLALGGRIGTVGMRMSDEAQTECDQGHCPSVRVTGTDIALVSVGANAVTSSKQCVLDTLGAVKPYSNFNASEISSRLARLTGMYSWYAFRRIKLTFVPLVAPTGVSGTGAVGAAEVCGLALLNNTSAVVNDGPSLFQQVLEIAPSVSFPAWEGGVLEDKFDGTKLWSCSTNNNTSNPDLLDSEQYALCGYWFGDPQCTIAIRSHPIYVEYTLDLYRPQEISSYPAVERPRLSLRALQSKLDSLARLLAAEGLADDDAEREEKGSPKSTVVVPRSQSVDGRRLRGP